MEKAKKIRVGNGVKKNPTWLKASVCIDTLEEHSFTYEGKRYAKIDINVFDQQNNYGKDVAITIDTYKPDGAKAAEKPKQTPEAIDEDGDLPF